MPRRKTAEVEILPADEKPKSRKKAVTAKHTVTYEAPEIVDVPIEDDEEIILEGEFEDEAEDKPKRKAPKNERDELRKKLAQSNVTPASQLKLSIERYLHSDGTEGGNWAESEHCTKYTCTEAHITNEDYLDVARKWGAGTYRFTLRMNNKIVTAWDKRLSTNAPPVTSILQNAIPGDPSSPQVVVQMPNSPQQAIVPMDALKAFKDQLQMFKLMREAMGAAPDAGMSTAQPLPLEPKVAALQLLAENPDVMSKVGEGIARTVMGNRGGHHESTWTDVAMEAIKSGQASEIVAAILREVMAPFRNIPGGNNGQAAMGNPQQPVNQSPQSIQHLRQIPMHQDTGEQRGDGVLSPQANEQASIQSAEEQILTPLLAFVIQQCANSTQPEIVANSVNNFLNQVAEQAPLQYPAVLAQVDLFGEMGTDAALEFVKRYQGGAEVAAMPHAREWTERLQQLIRESKEEGETE